MALLITNACPVDEDLFCMSYEDWTIKFWQWLISIPADKNPALDRTGDYAAVAQFGQPVFNLVFSDGTLDQARKCTVRAGQHILIPLNVIEVSFAEYPNARTEEDLHHIARWEFEDQCQPENQLSIDDEPRDSKERVGFKVHSRSFDINFPNNPIFGRPGPSRAVSDGYWIILNPLPAGKRRIEFSASLTNPLTKKLFYKDKVKYELNVLP